jgi:hypothetical protein
MTNTHRDSLEALGCDQLVHTDGVQVAILTAIREDYEAIEQRKRDRFERIMEMWCEGRRLTEEMFNANEGRSSGNLLLQAFKAFKVRLYGFVRPVAGRKTFIIVAIDPAKKQDRADPRVLSRAWKRSDDIGKGNVK